MEVRFDLPTVERIEEYWFIFEQIAEEGKYLGVEQAYPYEVTTHFIKNTIDKEIPFLFIVEEKGDRVIGWCDVQPITKDRGFLGVALLKAYRDFGIGRRAIENIIVVSKYYGYDTIELKVRASNKRAIYLYTTIGFVQSKRIKEGLNLNNEKEDLIEMILKI